MLGSLSLWERAGVRAGKADDGDEKCHLFESALVSKVITD